MPEHYFISTLLTKKNFPLEITYILKIQWILRSIHEIYEKTRTIKEINLYSSSTHTSTAEIIDQYDFFQMLLWRLIQSTMDRSQ